MSTPLSGPLIRDAIKSELIPRIAALRTRIHRPPSLTVILAGNDPASHIYVNSKTRTAEELGISSETLRPPDTVTTAEFLDLVRSLNARDDVDGILVQLPLPKQVNSSQVLLAVNPAKDVDGFHPCNVGALATGRPGPRPCTPAGIMEMLRRYEIAVAGKRAAVVGRSDIVGKPMSFLLLSANATVTIAHSRTADLAAVCREADILVAAIGRPAAIGREYIKPGAVVVDVGINRITDAAEAERIWSHDPSRLDQFRSKGSTLVGDVDPSAMVALSSFYTPVPGGVGPLTIAMLMSNTVEACERRAGLC